MWWEGEKIIYDIMDTLRGGNTGEARIPVTSVLSINVSL